MVREALLFLPIGILGIMTVGVLFLVAAVICLVVAVGAVPELLHRGSAPAASWRSAPLRVAGAGNVAAVGALLGDVAAEFSLQPPPPFPDAGVVFEHIESAGFALPLDAVKTVAQRRSFSREELTGFLRSQAAVALIRDAPEHLAEAITDALGDGVDRLRRHDGTYDQTFVRLEILARRPDG